ncbi:MAG: DNA recombination protein RmuC [Legionellales bacterium]|nr:DNA recombination protein RmuC [Legionellales bacterium]
MILSQLTYSIATLVAIIALALLIVYKFSALIHRLRPQEILLTQYQQQIQSLQQQLQQQHTEQEKQQLTRQFAIESSFQQFKEIIIGENTHSREQISQQQLKSLSVMQEGLQKTASSLQQQLIENVSHHTRSLNERMHGITQDIQKQLQSISQQVEKRLSDGFEKTTETFTRIVERLAVIDAAQKKITELSSSVINLQELLTDKRARGAFGEVQLSALLHNTLPENHFALQHTLSNGKRVDCMLFLPAPTGNIAIDAKFPLENFQTMLQPGLSEADRKAAEQRFRIDIRKHIQDIADKYIIEGETADGAVMFIPAEAIFAEIHGHYPDLISFAQKARVWLASPTTIMAILTTARAVLKDAATRKQVHIIQNHLQALAVDFGRFEKRMDALAKHIEQANNDVAEVRTSATKISSRFNKIEQVELVAEEEKI